jgi:tetratricopeptide (TPR) repeat protein
VTTERTEQDWLDDVRAQVWRGDAAAAQKALTGALAEYPGSPGLRRVQAGLHARSGRLAEAEALLQELLRERPDDAAAAFALAGMLAEQARMAAAANVMVACIGREPNSMDANLAIKAIELLDDFGRKREAAEIARAAIAADPDDPRLHAYAGMLQLQLGDFEQARRHYLFALQRSERAWEWHAPIGLALAQRYTDEDHPDRALFRDGLRRDDLSPLARAELCFALGKADDDLGRYERAAGRFREGHAIVHDLANWSGESWARELAGRSGQATSMEPPARSPDFTPVFIVGMPRSGTTLLAELLSRYPHVCNRGELSWIDRLARTPELHHRPAGRVLEKAAAVYRTQCRQDDAGDARWFLDKQPLNFRHIDLMLALFPDARIVYCRRNPRDTALSLWTQLFADQALGFSRRFTDIARVMGDCERLMDRAVTAYPASVQRVQYEALVDDPARVVAALAAWLGLPGVAGDAAIDPGAVGTSSVWQVRQPVYRTSVGRWRHYAAFVPELLEFAAA